MIPRRTSSFSVFLALAGCAVGLGWGAAHAASRPGADGDSPQGRAAVADLLVRSDPARAIGPDELSIRWLGTAGFEIRTARAALYIDPFFTRDSAWRILTGPVTSDPDRIRPYLHPADAVFVGHAHYDHLLDAPSIAKMLHAPLYASDDALRLAEAEGLPAAQRHVLHGSMRVKVGDMEVESVPSVHSDLITQRLGGGDMPDHIRLPMWALDYKNGPVFSFLIRWRGRALYHMGSAAVVESALPHERVDALLACISGWNVTPKLFPHLEAALHPRVFVPMHHDDFFKPFSAGFVEGPLAGYGKAKVAIRAAMPDAVIRPVGFFEDWRMRAVEGHRVGAAGPSRVEAVRP